MSRGVLELYNDYARRHLEVLVPLIPKKRYRDIWRGVVKSIHVEWPNVENGRLRIYSLYPGDAASSSESDFYNPFTESGDVYRANSAKYQLVLDTSPDRGHVQDYEVTEPVKRVLVIVEW